MTLYNRFRFYTILLLRIILHLFYVFPIVNKKILFCSYGGTKIACNPYYVYLALIKRYPDQFQIYWVSETYDTNRIREQDTIIRPSGIRFLYHLLSASIIIDNDGFKSYIPIRKKQFYINTWHGGGLFKTAYGASRSNEEKEYNQRIDILKKGDIKLLVSTSALWTKRIARYRFHYDGEVLECGYPRNDLFFQKRQSISQKVKSDLKIDSNEKIVLFAPTYRGGLFKRVDSTCLEGLNITELINALEKRFKAKFCFVYRGHHATNTSNTSNNMNYIDATNYADMQDLLDVADVFISDYSSCLWDFSLTSKPCFIFALDFEDYIVDPGFESDYKEWPFPIARSNEDLITLILSYDEIKSKKNIRKYHDIYGSFEKGHAAESIVNRLVKYL